METVKYQIIFKGEISSGGKPEKVKQDVAALFKLDANQLQRIFSGDIVTLKKGITYEQGQKYQNKLKSLGAIVYLREEARSFSVRENAPDDVGAASQVYKPPKIRDAASKKGKQSNYPVVPPAIFSFDFSGRYGRLNFINVLCIVFLTFGICIITALLIPAITQPAIIFLAVLCLLLTIRIVAIRLHDLNINGWFSILIFVPIIDLVLLLVLLICSGSKTYNKYGNPPMRGSFTGLMISLVLLALVPLWYGKATTLIMPLYYDFMGKSSVHHVYQEMSGYGNEVDIALDAGKIPMIGSETTNEKKYYPLGMVSGNITQSSSAQTSIKDIAIIGIDKDDNNIKLYAIFDENIPKLSGVTLILHRRAKGIWDCIVDIDKQVEFDKKYLPENCRISS